MKQRQHYYVLFLVVVLCCPGKGFLSSILSTRQKSSPLWYDTSSEQDHRIDLPSLSNETKASLENWLCSLRTLERSEPNWVGTDILTLSPSALLQEQLTSLCPIASLELFENHVQRAAFDFHWRSLLLKSLPSADLADILQNGRSNSHPLRLQLIAFPTNCELKVHVHAAVELAVPLYGEYCQRRSKLLLPRDGLHRSVEHALGTPLSNFSQQPTPQELAIIKKDLSKRVSFPNAGIEGRFEKESLYQGQCLVNQVGSVHQSFTSDENPCLLWVLGPNVQAHFLRGQFHQVEGIEELSDIYDTDMEL